MKTFRIILVGALIVALRTDIGLAQPVDVPKTNPMKVYMHYMPWFETPATLGGDDWGFHWGFRNRNPNIVDATGKRQIASHYYPKIGAYASSDPDVIEYHLLLMKLSGVDGVMINWYGVQGTNSDINRLLTNSNSLINKVDDFGLDFGVIMEDRFSANIDQAKANVDYLRDHYFDNLSYIRLGASQNPLVGVFGPITFQQPEQWSEILDETSEDREIDFLTLWYEKNDAGPNADGEYAWIYEEENLDNHLTHQANFYRHRAAQLDTAGGVAYPGFNDYYQEGGVGNIVAFEIPHNNGQTLNAVLNLASQYASAVDFLQLATFNDFGEGTMFEPTVETGFEYLKTIQQFTGTPYGEEELQLVYRLYVARKKYSTNPLIDADLDQVSSHLAELRIDDAVNLLNAAAPAGDYDADGDVDAQDYAAWRTAFGTMTISYGSGADGNYDGIVDAADYLVWRDSIDVVGTSTNHGAAPEPSTIMLSVLAAVACPAIYSTGLMQRRRVRGVEYENKAMTQLRT
jgi:hypothetical protein